MGKTTGFLEFDRELPAKRPVHERVQDYQEIYHEVGTDQVRDQAARCMDCGVPFCHSSCPLGNIIPDFNDAVYREDWHRAWEILSTTNNFPEFTGRICPAPCEAGCVLGINADPVAIEHIERNIAERAYAGGWVTPAHPEMRTGQRVAVVGSGPAGLAAAEQLNRAGHWVTVFERNDKVGGLLRYGIPDFKLEKHTIDRKVALMEAAGIEFQTNANVGENVSVTLLRADYDAIVLTGGSTIARNLGIPGRDLKGVHFAMEFLEQKNRQVAGQTEFDHEIITATDKDVVVIGGGDTGADCTGTSNREGARSVTQLELLGKPPAERDASTPWPMWPMQLRTSTSHEEGCDRQWAMQTKEFLGDEDGNLRALKLVRVEAGINPQTGRFQVDEVAGTEHEIPAQLALLAVGFLHPQREGLLEKLGVELDARGNVDATNYQTSVEGVFAAGDMRRGQSLVVWAIAEGREAAVAVDAYLRTGESVLVERDNSGLTVA